MATDVMGAKKLNGKRKWQSSQEEGKKRSSGEDTPRKRRRAKDLESPKSSPSKSPFVTDSDECPTFRTKSFYRSKGNSKFAAINPQMKENTPSPKKKLTPRRTSNRISSRISKGSESEPENLESGSPMVRKCRLKSLKSSDSDSESNAVKVLRSRANLLAEKEKEYDFPSVMPFKKGSQNDILMNSVSVKHNKNKKNVSLTPPAKKVSDKKFFSTKCPSSAPKSFGSVIVRKGFNLKFVPKRISDQFSEKSSAKKTPKLAEKLRKLKQKEDKKSIARNASLNSSSIGKINDIDIKESVHDKEKNDGKVLKNTPPVKDASPDSAVITQMSCESVNISRPYNTPFRNGSSQLITSSVDGSQELFSDAVSDVSVASIVSGPSERKLRSGITYSPSRGNRPGNLLDSPPRKRLDCASASKSPITKTPDKRRELSQESCHSDLNSKISDESFSSFSQEDELSSGGTSTGMQKLCEDKNRGENRTTSEGRPLFSIFNTPEQRKSLRNITTASPSISSSSPSNSSRVSPKLKKMLKDNDSKNAEQLILDAGQKKFGATVCDVCGMVYTHADPLDETTHAKFHTSLVNALKFPGWKKERIVQEYLLEGSRVIMVLSDDPGYAIKKVAEINKIMGQELGFPEQTMSFDSKYKAFLYISENKTVEGCCIAESIQEGYRVIPEQTEQNSSVPVGSDVQAQRPWYCETVPEKADIGISRIWVCKQARQKGIGSRLLDSIRSCFHYGGVIDKNKIAFSDPTSEGKKFATKYTGSPAFLVYKYAR